MEATLFINGKATMTLIGGSRYRDGGTEKYVSKKNIEIVYFVDKRINSKTKGKVYDKYPGDKGAKLLEGYFILPKEQKPKEKLYTQAEVDKLIEKERNKTLTQIREYGQNGW